jgi:hypothetical protein
LSKAKGRGILSIKRAGIMRILVENAGRIFATCLAYPLHRLPWLTRCTVAYRGERSRHLCCLADLGTGRFVMLLGASPADAEAGHLFDRLTPEVMAIVWPEAEELGPEEGKPASLHSGARRRCRHR